MYSYIWVLEISMKLPHLFFILVFVLFSSDGKLGKKYATTSSTTQSNPECVSFALEELPPDKLTEQNITREAVINVWKVGIFKKPTPLLKELQDVVLSMVYSDSLLFSRITLRFTAWAASLFPYMHNTYPSFCPMAKVMNLTAQWHKTGDKKKYLSSLDSLMFPAVYGYRMLTYTILKQQGCNNLEIPKSLDRNCWRNGFVFEIDFIWKEYARLLPWPLHNVIEKLYKSQIFQENAAAALFSYLLCPQLSVTWGPLNISMPLEFIRLYTATANNQLPRCCCEFNMERTSELVNFLDINAETSINNEKDEILNGC